MKKIRIGVFGGGMRGRQLISTFMLLNCEIAAVCERREGELLKAQAAAGGAAAYREFDEFIRHPMDAVILTNAFHRHAPYAIACLERGLHVFCECISNGTMAEGVALARAYDASRAIYMLAENYPQMLTNREIKRVCDGGTLGKLLYAEGEYNHPCNPNDIQFKKDFTYTPTHWRNYLPRTYYITHSLGPIMWATGATPRRVSAYACFAPIEGAVPTASRVGDRAAIITTQNDDGSVFRVTGCAAFGGHHNSYRVCGTNGQIESLRGMTDTVMLRYNGWQVPHGASAVSSYTPAWNDPDEDLIKKSGHGGADYLTARMFLDCVREGTQPPHPFHLYAALAMSSVAILGHRSMLAGGVPFDIPDLSSEADRARYENDTATPFFSEDGTPPALPCCSQADFSPTEEQLALFKRLVEE